MAQNKVSGPRSYRMATYRQFLGAAERDVESAARPAPAPPDLLSYNRSLAVFSDTPDYIPQIGDVIEAEFHPDVFNRENITIWLALWGEIVTNPALGAEHRRKYKEYREGVAAALRQTATARQRTIDTERLAVMIISLIDGLWLEYCIAPELMSAQSAKEACYEVLEPFLGRLSQSEGRPTAP